MLQTGLKLSYFLSFLPPNHPSPSYNIQIIIFYAKYIYISKKPITAYR